MLIVFKNVWNVEKIIFNYGFYSVRPAGRRKLPSIKLKHFFFWFIVFKNVWYEKKIIFNHDFYFIFYLCLGSDVRVNLKTKSRRMFILIEKHLYFQWGEPIILDFFLISKLPLQKCTNIFFDWSYFVTMKNKQINRYFFNFIY